MLDETPDPSTIVPETYDGPILEIENLSISFFTRLRGKSRRGDGFFHQGHARRGHGPCGRVGLRQVDRGRSA